MSVWIGDLMAVADDESGRAPRSKKEGSNKQALAQTAPEYQKQNPSAKLQHLPPKLKGELGELDFLRKAMGMGMLVSKPWGDSYSYDFVVDWQGRLSRTQVRSTERRSGMAYAVHATLFVANRSVPLTAKDIDVLVAYVSTRDIWYVLPVRAFSPRTALSFYPDGSTKGGGQFEQYREAWWVMMENK